MLPFLLEEVGRHKLTAAEQQGGKTEVCEKPF